MKALEVFLKAFEEYYDSAYYEGYKVGFEDGREHKLIIKTNILMKAQEMDNLRRSVLKQAEEGVIILPPYCEVCSEPGDMTIAIDSEEEV